MSIWPEDLKGYAQVMPAEPGHRIDYKAWFSLAHTHKHKDIRTRRMAYLTQFSIPGLPPRQPDDKQDGARSVRHIAFDMFAWGMGQSDL